MKKLWAAVIRLPFRKLFIAAMLIRLILMPVTGHWDQVATHAIANTFFQNGWKGFYVTSTAAYPPLVFLSMALWQWIIHPLLLPDFTAWLNAPLMLVFGSPHAFRYFFLMKLLYVPFDIGILLLLRGFGKNEKEKQLFSILWLFNPVVLYIVYMWGSFDIIPTFFAVLGISLIYRKSSLWGFWWLGVGAAFKIWPLLLIIPVAVTCNRTWGKRLLAAAIGFGSFVLFIAPYLPDPNFRSYVLTSDRVSLIGNAELYMGFSQSLYIFLLLYIAGIFAAMKYAKTRDHILDISFASLIWFFVFSAYTPQFFLWILPFITVYLVRYPRLRYMIPWILAGYMLIILTFDAPLSYGLFSPVESSLLHAPTLQSVVDHTVPASANKIWSAFRSVNSAILLWFLYEWFEARKNSV